MMLKRILLLTATPVALLMAPVHAIAGEPEEWGDHRLVPRVDGSEIITYRFTEYDRVTLTFGPYDDGEFPDEREFEGEHTQLTYLLRDTMISTLQVKRAYRQGLEQAGFEIEFAGSGRDDLGRRFHRFDTFDRDRPSGLTVHHLGWPRSRSERDMRFLAASHEEESVYVNVLMYNNRRDDGQPTIRVDVVEEPQEEATLAMAAPEPPEEQPTERDEIVAAHDREDLSAEEIEAGIISEGRVAVRDILFEFDSAEIIDESADALATIADVLEDNSELDLLIVGHTDNVGDFEYNLNLSMERAQAVASWLEDQHGIDEDRLQSAGAGMMAPVATNRNEEGRSQNRRVELVEL
ncbi:OmpA family protein [Wenzhouxiangella sp. AB-CW3]|uniref:OmpA family protein n=1 Tax=Wenzhouxiangella sp. AB-CW3 TaxID=2771012 RepID=UPI00168B51BB|nr:OmpA family protein [Wenzhouxiangella sp. AB-CW3]QOC22135.1 OmpA family protein [Wenzhouxiangella sp. AB-CW3]